MLKSFQIHANTNKSTGVLDVAHASESNEKSKDILMACTAFLQIHLQYYKCQCLKRKLQYIRSTFNVHLKKISCPKRKLNSALGDVCQILFIRRSELPRHPQKKNQRISNK